MSKRFREIKSYFRDQGIKANNHDIRRIIHLGNAFKKQYKRYYATLSSHIGTAPMKDKNGGVKEHD